MHDQDIPDPSRPDIELKLGEQLNALLSASHALSVQSAAHFDAQLQPAAFQIARWLYSFGPANATTLAHAVAMDRSATSRLVGQLKRLDFVESNPDPEDGRGVIVSLTALGKHRVKEAFAEREIVFQERIKHWNDADLVQFVELLTRFNTSR